MKSYDNNGKLVGEINRFRTADGKSITTNTQYNSYNGRPVSQNITVQESSGKVTTMRAYGPVFMRLFAYVWHSKSADPCGHGGSTPPLPAPRLQRI